MRLWRVGGGRLFLRLGFGRRSLTLRLGGFLGLAFGLGRFLLSLRRRLAVAPDFSDHGADGGALALGDDDLAQLARGVGLNLDVGLVALDLDQRLALLDLLAFLLQPAQDLAGLHRVREAWHLNVGHRRLPSSFRGGPSRSRSRRPCRERRSSPAACCREPGLRPRRSGPLARPDNRTPPRRRARRSPNRRRRNASPPPR